MPDLNDELEELHRSVISAVRDRLDNGERSNDDIRTALQLLKQNSITAKIEENTADELRKQMAKKLDFSALKGKVVPLNGGGQEPLPESPRKSGQQ